MTKKDVQHSKEQQEMQEVAGEEHSKTPNYVLQDPKFDQDPKMLTDLTARNPDIEPKPEVVGDPKLETDEMIREPMTGRELRDGPEAHGFQGDPKLLTDAERRGMDPDTGLPPEDGKAKSAGQRINRKGQ